MNDADWTVGRVGMLYRDLTPERFREQVAVSHIRLPFDGEVPDYVHFHKVEFQVIYCLKGRIKVVYEDQGPAFWLETGDCVLQPPEIRHRVLECTAGAEVIEVVCPAEHETLVEVELALPTERVDTRKDFVGQRFVRHIAAGESDGVRDTGIAAATVGAAHVTIVRDHGMDTRLLLTLSGLGAKGDHSLGAPISLEIAI